MNIVEHVEMSFVVGFVLKQSRSALRDPDPPKQIKVLHCDLTQNFEFNHFLVLFHKVATCIAVVAI